jgi:hypothetical protein
MNVTFITPPRTASAIKYCLCFAEDIPARHAQLFSNLSGDSESEDHIQDVLLVGNGPENPMALVHLKEEYSYYDW